MKRFVFVVLFLWIALVRAGGQTFPWFTNTYGRAYGTNFIWVAPWNAQGIFYEGDAVTISNLLGTAVEVYDFHFNPITNAVPPAVLTHLGLGHYFIQVNGTNGGLGDRASFSVLPRNYTNHPHMFIGSDFDPGDPGWSNRFVRLAPGHSRDGVDWATVSTNFWTGWPSAITILDTNGNVISNNWQAWDGLVFGYAKQPNCTWFDNAPVKILNFHADHTNSPSSPTPTVDKTNSLSSWIADVTAMWSNIVVRYGTNAAYEIQNEPSYNNLDFRPTGDDPYTNAVPEEGGAPIFMGKWPLSMLISASVQTIRSICPSCQVWAPAAGGLGGGECNTFTSDYLRVCYSNVDVLSFHDRSSQYGGPDTYNLCYPTTLVQALEKVTRLYPGKKWAVDEWYPASPSSLGKSNAWCGGFPDQWAATPGVPGIGPYAVPNIAWDWRMMVARWSKELIIFKWYGVVAVQQFITLQNDGIAFWNDGNSYCGWDLANIKYFGVSDDYLGRGPVPQTDQHAMLAWWLEGAAPLANWQSGSTLWLTNCYAGYYSNGVPGLHFWSFAFTNGTTNTFLWADEGFSFTTNFGVGITDIYSNQWTGSIGEEPVIAWGWPNNSLGGSFSIAPRAAFSATPTEGSAPLAVTFVDSSCGAITNRHWEFGDGFVTNTPELTIIHQYAKDGIYTVQLAVSGPGGVSSDAQPCLVAVTSVHFPSNAGGSNALPPFTGGTGGQNLGTNSLQSTFGALSNGWRLLITY
jgi:PKD repeat protein